MKNKIKTSEDIRIENILETIWSLNMNLLKAGGTPLTLTELKETSVYDLCCFIATNGIRFNYDKNLVSRNL